MTHATEAEPSRRWRGFISPGLLSLAISTALLALGAWIMGHRIDWRAAIAVWANFDPLLVAAVLVLSWLQFPVNSYRLQRVVLWVTAQAWSAAPRFRFFFKLTCSAAFVAVAAPMGVAGDAAKIAGLRLFGSLSTTDAARSALFDRVTGMQWLSIIGLALLPMQFGLGVDRTVILSQFALFGGLLGAVGLLLVFPRALRLIGSRFIDQIANVFAGYRVLLSAESLSILFGILMINILLSWGALYLLVRASGLQIDGWLLGGFIPLLLLVNGVPFLYMGWGGRELVMATTLGVGSGLSLDQTLAVSIAWGVVTIVTSAINGVFLLGDWRAVRQAPVEGTHAPELGTGPGS